MADPGPVGVGAAEEGLFSRTYAAATSSFVAVMFLTGLAALAVVPTLPTAVRDLDGVTLFPLVAGCFVTASLLGGVLGGHWAEGSGTDLIEECRRRARGRDKVTYEVFTGDPEIQELVGRPRETWNGDGCSGSLNLSSWRRWLCAVVVVVSVPETSQGFEFCPGEMLAPFAPVATLAVRPSHRVETAEHSPGECVDGKSGRPDLGAPVVVVAAVT
jgi:hypothetical protein